MWGRVISTYHFYPFIIVSVIKNTLRTCKSEQNVKYYNLHSSNNKNKLLKTFISIFFHVYIHHIFILRLKELTFIFF